MAEATVNLWAVVQTGVVTKDSDIVAFRTDGGERVPVICFMHADRGKVERKRKQLLRKLSKVQYAKDAAGKVSFVGTPVLSIQSLVVAAPTRRGPRKADAPAVNGEAVQVEPATADTPVSEQPAPKGRRFRKHATEEAAA